MSLSDEKEKNLKKINRLGVALTTVLVSATIAPAALAETFPNSSSFTSPLNDPAVIKAAMCPPVAGVPVPGACPSHSLPGQ